jgi:predicted transcriptional regulator
MAKDEVVLTVRVPVSLAEQVRQVAESRDETTSQVIRRSLRRYVSRRPGPKSSFSVNEGDTA